MSQSRTPVCSVLHRAGVPQKSMTAAETNSKPDIEAATKQIELALFMENRLQMKTERRFARIRVCTRWLGPTRPEVLDERQTKR